MYIAPNSDLWLLKGVPLDPSYDHTIYWDKSPDAIQNSKLQQVNHFKLHYQSLHIDKNMYIRSERGYIKVGFPSERLYDYNYLIFRNNWENISTIPPTNDPNGKWFFCFITKIEYVNNKESLVHFEIDVMQTWHFDYELEQCYVERNHTPTDFFGDNTVPEKLPTGDEYICNETVDYDMNNLAMVILYTPDKPAEGKTITSNVFSGLLGGAVPAVHYDEHGIKQTFGQDCYQLIETASTLLGDFGNKVVQIYEVPMQVVTPQINTGNDEPNDTFFPSRPGSDVNKGKRMDEWNYSIAHSNGKYNDTFVDIFECGDIPTDLNGYEPKNKKLFCYPYCFGELINYCGDNRIIKNEYFWVSKNRINFAISGVPYPVPEMRCEPMHYRNMTIDASNSLSYNNFPMCGWGNDAFKAWIAQNWGSVLMTAVSAGASLLVPGAGGVAVGAGAAAAGTLDAIGAVNAGLKVGSIFASMVQATQLPNVAKSAGGQTLNAGEKYIKFSYRKMSIKKEFAVIIDNYFTRFGYAIMDNIKPYINARPHWTYVKTLDCTVKGSMPSESMNKVISVYNNGITWWNDADEIGNYSLDNAPLTHAGRVGVTRVGLSTLY